jgi:hypothetical protein
LGDQAVAKTPVQFLKLESNWRLMWCIFLMPRLAGNEFDFRLHGPDPGLSAGVRRSSKALSYWNWALAAAPPLPAFT